MVMASGLFGITFRDALDTSGLAIDFIADSFKNALVEDGYTPNFNTHSVIADITNECAGTGYVAGGKAVTTPTLVVSGGFLTFDADDTAWTASTIPNIEGRVLNDDTVAADPLICATDFGSTYAVTNGTFTIQESASGIWRISL